jgi:hypothetical protein
LTLSPTEGRVGAVKGDIVSNVERVVLDVDDRGRVSLGKFGFRSMQVVASSTSDGGLILHPAVVMTPAEAAHYQNPEAIALLNRAMESASSGEVAPLKLRSQPDDS